jgi:hypothetical protein
LHETDIHNEREYAVVTLNIPHPATGAAPARSTYYAQLMVSNRRKEAPPGCTVIKPNVGILITTPKTFETENAAVRCIQHMLENHVRERAVPMYGNKTQPHCIQHDSADHNAGPMDLPLATPQNASKLPPAPRPEAPQVAVTDQIGLQAQQPAAWQGTTRYSPGPSAPRKRPAPSPPTSPAVRTKILHGGLVGGTGTPAVDGAEQKQQQSQEHGEEAKS